MKHFFENSICFEQFIGIRTDNFNTIINIVKTFGKTKHVSL